MNVGIFYNSISNPAKFSNKTMLMDIFAEGVRVNGDTPVEFREPGVLPQTPLDAGFILGYTVENNFRRQIIDTLRTTNTPQVYVDSNILHYARPEHEWHRYSLNSVYPGEGVYFFNEVDRNKWFAYSQWHNVSLKPYRADGNHILVLTQRPKGWNMNGVDQTRWVLKTLRRLRELTPRPIILRTHPGDGKRELLLAEVRRRFPEVKISENKNIHADLINCWCAVGYNSTPNVVAAIEGVPVMVADPSKSWAADVAFTNIDQVVNPPLPDRTDWVHKIANIHWSNEEVRSGKLWAAIKTYILSARQ